ncbi:MAG: Calcium-binding acidic-repeat protein (ARP) [uncultured Sulfurovum sp.]|uniref:Calcium-binding acidic-repeat protein (ARP) n=1 Tax=uncultured Sulfurovum sp. TaxID=269237 RepID=A0A6S6STP5_9BACT|nr:MAG: Calcium-binding acidic-repeat protein (ARP) [uncultured Sulfurovum sp.]
MYIFKYFLFLFLLNISILYSAIYENAEDKKITRWSLLKISSFGEIKNINDSSKKSRVIQLLGNHTRSTYILSLEKKNIKHKHTVLSWEMKYAEDFVIMIQVDSTTGEHTLIYTPGYENLHLQYGLGTTATQGQWQTYQRNIEQDLKNFIRNSKLLRVKNFVVKGSGFFDNIQLITVDKENENNQTIKTKKLPLKKITKVQKANKPTNTMPKIYLKGDNPIVLEKGDAYFEEGATAITEDGTELSVNISHQIDTFREGEYSVIYITTNHIGNSVIEKRRVIVGEINENQEEVLDKENVEEAEEEEDQESASEFEKRSKELSTWEKALEAREAELRSNKAVKSNSPNQTTIDYPKRPGL